MLKRLTNRLLRYVALIALLVVICLLPIAMIGHALYYVICRAVKPNRGVR